MIAIEVKNLIKNYGEIKAVKNINFTVEKDSFVGFLGGIYIPIGILGKNVQSVMNLLPTAHSVTLMRNVYMNEAIDLVFTGAPQDVFDNYSYIYGLEVNIGDFAMGSIHLILSMVVFAPIFYVLSVIKLLRAKL